MPPKKTTPPPDDPEPKAADPVAPAAVAIPLPRVDVIERGLQHVFGVPAPEIRLKDPQLVCHWIDSSIRADKMAQADAAGYLKTRLEYVANVEDMGGYTISPDGWVTRGIRCQEYLMYTTKENVVRRGRAKAEENRRRMRVGAAKQDVVAAAGAQLGDQAADFLNRSVRITGDVTHQREIVQRTPEIE